MNVALGVGGGIAAYKAAELARALMERGFSVQVVMTAAAEEFVRPLTFAALTGRKVITNLFSAASSEDTLASAIEHIRVAQENEILVVAPATADLLAKFAHGIADDFLTTIYLAFTGRVVLAPAMNTNMWRHPATRENLRILSMRGHEIVEPEDGALACGMVGPGRLADPEKIAEAVANGLAVVESRSGRRDGAGHGRSHAGAARRSALHHQPVQRKDGFRGGRGSRRAGRARGAGLRTRESARSERHPDDSCADRARNAQGRDGASARRDHHHQGRGRGGLSSFQSRRARRKRRPPRGCRSSSIPTPDILAEIGQKKGDRLLVGFAAETDHLAEEARRKLESKNCDMIVANLVSQDGTGFDSDENEVLLVLRTGQSIPVPRAPKREIARRILDEAIKLRLTLHAHAAGRERS